MTQPAVLPEVTITGNAPAPPPVQAEGPDTSKWIDRPDEGDVAIRLPHGGVRLVARKDLARAEDELQARAATEPEYYGAKAGPLEKGGAAALGAANIVSYGVSDPIAIEAARQVYGDQGADDARRVIGLSREALPGWYHGGQVAGMAGQVYFGSSGGTAVRSIAGHALQGSMIGTAAGLGNQLSEDAIANKPFAAESYVTAGLKGGAIGAIVGGGAGLFGRGAEKLAERYGARVEGATERAAERPMLGPYRSAEQAAEEASSKGQGGALEALENYGQGRAFKALGGTKPQIAALGEDIATQEARAQRIGARVQEAVEREGQSFATASQEKISAAVNKQFNEQGAALGRIRSDLDKVALPAEKPDVVNISRAFNERAEQIMEKNPLTGAKDLEAAEDLLRTMTEKAQDGKLGFNELARMRRNIFSKAKGDEAMQALGHAAESELERSIEVASGAQGAEKLASYKLAKEAYADLRVAREMVQGSLERRAAGGTFGFKDYLVAAAAAATGHPLGALAPVASKYAREYGNQIQAHVVSKVTKLESVQRLAADLDGALQNGAERFLSGKASKAPERMVTNEEVRQIRQAVSSPEAVQARIGESLSDLHQHAPTVASQAAATLTRAAVWLRDNLPKETPPLQSGLQARQPMPLSDSQLRTAGNIIEAIENPEMAFDRLMQGKLTPEFVATLKAVHLSSYEAMQTYMREHAAELRQNLTIQQEIQASILFQQPLNEIVLPDNVAAFQAVFAAKKPPGGGVGSNVANIGKLGGTRATSWDRQEAGT